MIKKTIHQALIDFIKIDYLIRFTAKKHLPDRRLVSPLVVWLIGASYGDTEITLKPDDSFEEEKKSTEMSNNETQETLNMTKITKLELNSPA